MYKSLSRKLSAERRSLNLGPSATSQVAALYQKPLSQSNGEECSDPIRQGESYQDIRLQCFCKSGIVRVASVDYGYNCDSVVLRDGKN